MGLPGSGKTYLTKKLQPFNAAWYNADKVRSMANDWVFQLKVEIDNLTE